MNNKPFGNINRMAAYLAALLFAWVLALPAFGDGKVFPAVAFPAEVKIPDQSALLIWSNGVERLVIETRFVGEGTNFAWVVPLPSVPEIEPATTGVFPTLRLSLQPEIKDRLPRYWGVALLLGGILWLWITVRVGGEAKLNEIVAGTASGVGAGGLVGHGEAGIVIGCLVAGSLILLAYRRRRSASMLIAALLWVFLISLLVAALLPGLSVAKSKGALAEATIPGVELLAAQRVGNYETATVAARNAAALPLWLQTNGFVLARGSQPIINHYASNGWVFVAIKLNRYLNSTNRTSPHPLSFSFPTPLPVYPLRLTGVGSSHLDVDLFVIGPKRAEVSGFKVTECHLLETETIPWRWSRFKAGRIGHPLIKQWVGIPSVVTRLSGSLDAAAMQDDAWIQWKPFSAARTVFHSKRGAVTEALNWATTVLVLGLLGGAIAARLRRLDTSISLRLGIISMLVACLIGGVVYVGVFRTDVRVERIGLLRSRNYLEFAALDTEERFQTNGPVTIEEVRRTMEQTLKRFEPHIGNPFSGGPIREEDSPGNYTVRKMPKNIEITAYDAVGTPAIVGSIPFAESR